MMALTGMGRGFWLRSGKLRARVVGVGRLRAYFLIFMVY